jgi:CheY-like chemotaxis protein
MTEINQLPIVMVVDDDDDTRLIMAELIRREGCVVVEAANARDAESKALHQVPDLILMDLNMPGRDGLNAVWRLRDYPETASVPIVIVSAYDAFDLRAEASAAGCVAYLTKPVVVDQLKALIASIVGEPR